VRPSHLFVGTAADNNRDMILKGRRGVVSSFENVARGEAHHNAKLSAAQVVEIRWRYAAGGVTHEDLAAEYGVSRRLIGRVIAREMWKHVD
jgi:hypothetical protein